MHSQANIWGEYPPVCMSGVNVTGKNVQKLQVIDY